MEIMGIINRKGISNYDINVLSTDLVKVTDGNGILYEYFNSFNTKYPNCKLISEYNDLRKSTTNSEVHLMHLGFVNENSNNRLLIGASLNQYESPAVANDYKHFVAYIVKNNPNFSLETDFFLEIVAGQIKHYNKAYFEEDEIVFTYNSTYKYLLIAAPQVKQLPVLFSVNKNYVFDVVSYNKKSIRNISYSTYMNSKGIETPCVKLYFNYYSDITLEQINLTMKSFKYPQTPIN